MRRPSRPHSRLPQPGSEPHTDACPESTALRAPQRTYGFLKGVDEVLQVNVVPVGFDVALEELAEPVPHPVLEQEGQHGHGQLEEEDEHDGAAELGTRRERESPPCTSADPPACPETLITGSCLPTPRHCWLESYMGGTVRKLQATVSAISSEGSRGSHRHTGCLRAQNLHRTVSFLAGLCAARLGVGDSPLHKAMARSTAAPGHSGGDILEGPTQL